MIARFPYGHSEHDAVTDWLVSTVIKAKADKRISEVAKFKKADTPITMLRNLAMLEAKKAGVDFVLMIDSDMDPDKYLGIDPTAKPFWDVAIDFALSHQGPCVIAAPYSGPPPHELPYIGQWTNRQSDHPDADLKLEMMTREQAAVRTGIEEVAALPTGIILIDVRCLEYISPPWFDYEYADPPFNTEKATTEDIYFTRNLSLAGVPQYVAWDCWAGHLKQKSVGKPRPLNCDVVRKEFREAIVRNQPSDEKLVFFDGQNEGKQPHELIVGSE
jgi:hypothetical protein